MNMLTGDVNTHWVPGITLDSIERSTIMAALKFYRGNVAQTAIALGVTEKTIRNKVEKYEADEKLRADANAFQRIEQGRILDRMRGINVNEDQTRGVPPNEQKSFEANSGIQIQPLKEVPPKQSLPVPERKEVQGMLHKSASGSGHRKSR